MSAIKLFTHASYAAGIALQFACAGLLISRRIHREYQFFFWFLLFQASTDLVLETLSYALVRNIAYFYIYWTQNALADIFAFAVFYELFCAAFKPFAGLRDMAQVVFRWAALALLLVGGVVFCSSALPNWQRVTLVVVNMERSICVMQCGLLLFLFMGSTYLGLSKRSRVFGMSLGFGLIATLNLLILTVSSLEGYYNPRTHSLFDLAQAFVVLFAAGIWVFYVARPEPARAAVNVPVTSPLLRWNEVAMALGHSGGRVAFVNSPEPFMPNVERMVDEVLKRDLFLDTKDR